MDEEVQAAIGAAAGAGNTAWMLTATALVLFMIPGLALFYGGMTRVKSVLNMFMMVFVSGVIVTILWVIFGYSAAFAPSYGEAGLLGNLSDFFMFKDVYDFAGEADPSAVPTTVFAAFQLVFACITVALIAGAIADRMKFGVWMVFAGVWASLVYFPVAHWVFNLDPEVGGWIYKMGAIDFAGGTAVHINAGAAGLALCIVLGKRLGWPTHPMRPHNLTLVMLGAGILWFGWFGFNAGSEVAADGIAGIALINTLICPFIAMGFWLLTEKIRDGHATSLGAASGIVAGLVAITPACASLNAWSSIVLGIIAGVVCCLAVGLKYKLGFDDSLDVVGVHLVGGIIGTLWIGFGAETVGLFLGGGGEQLWIQFKAAIAVLAFSFIVTFLIAKILDLVVGIRLTNDDETEGIDVVVHGESAYELEGSAIGHAG